MVSGFVASVQAGERNRRQNCCGQGEKLSGRINEVAVLTRLTGLFSLYTLPTLLELREVAPWGNLWLVQQLNVLTPARVCTEASISGTVALTIALTTRLPTVFSSHTPYIVKILNLHLSLPGSYIHRKQHCADRNSSSQNHKVNKIFFPSRSETTKKENREADFR